MNGATNLGWETVRVFVSSTFRDMQAERDYLAKWVFPELRQWCAQWWISLVDVDLRWGVHPEAGLTGQFVGESLQAIDRCRPFFISLLGRRSGTVPSGLPQSVLDAYPGLQNRRHRSVTHLEIQHAAIESLSNPGGPGTCEECFFYLRDERAAPLPTEPVGWTQDQRDQYERAFIGDSSPNLALRDLPPSEHLAPDGRMIRVRHYHPVFDPTLDNPEDPALPGRFTAASLVGLGTQVERDLREAIRKRFAQRIDSLRRHRGTDVESRESYLQEGFLKQRVYGATSRPAVLDSLRQYVVDDDRRVLALVGSSGSGKTSALAQFCDGWGGDRRLFYHFVGASPSSALPSALVGRILDWAGMPTTRGRSPREHLDAFLERQGRDCLLLIDGVDQLSTDGASRRLAWLPAALREGSKIIISAAHGPLDEIIERRGDRVLPVCGLTPSERQEMARSFLSEHNKELESPELQSILGRDAAKDPLYLAVALEELRLFGSFENLPGRVAGLAHSTDAMFGQLLGRLEIDHASDLAGVRRFFGLLACSRAGLTLDELDALMGGAERVHRTILRKIRAYIHLRASRLDFFHLSLARAVRERYLDRDVAKQRHRQLADYFLKRPLPSEEQLRAGDPAALRRIEELPFQLRHGQRWSELDDTVTQPEFLRAKIIAPGFGIEDLMSDCGIHDEFGTGVVGHTDVSAAMFRSLDNARLEVQRLSEMPRGTASVGSHLYAQLRRRGD